MYDIFFVGTEEKFYDSWINFKNSYPIAKRVSSFYEAQEKTITKFFWVVWSDIILDNNFDFNFKPDDWSQDYIHVFLNNKFYDGIWLVPKKIKITQKEVEHRFPVNRKELNIIGSYPRKYDYFEIENYDDYLEAFENSKTDMFWMSSSNIEVNKEIIETYYYPHGHHDKKYNHAFIHRVKNDNYYNGLFLCTKQDKLSKKEVEHRFPVNRKELNIIGSYPKKYNQFKVENYDDYLEAFENSSTELFYIIPTNVEVNESFKFNLYFTFDNFYDRKINHVFLNGKYHDGIILCSKFSKISKREFDFGFITHKKEYNYIASKPKPYDIVFISYEEPNADDNYEILKKRFPNAKRINGVKGIHQAHIEAAKLCDTDMFWVVDGDAQIADSFNFDYQVPSWNKDTVHVWRSKNPINNLVYGYGGVKLLPKKLTINMDTTSSDMTTSISKKFKSINEVSNITNFNTDPFNTWKSAFRECAKLSSRVIDRQKEDETNDRLQTWQSAGINQKFGDFCIRGAKEGSEFGKRYKDDLEKLKLINNFDWLKEKFNGNT